LFEHLKKIAILYYLLFPKLFGLGYNQYKIWLIKKILKKKIYKTKNYIDERIVEIPWVIGHLKSFTNIKILDAGCTLNHKYLIDEVLLNKNTISFVNLYKEKFSDSRNSVSYMESDISNLNIENDTYNIVTCISVLEHIGFDNQIYNHSKTINKNLSINRNLYINGILEIKRVLAKNGVAYLSFPFGLSMSFNNLQQFDMSDVNKILEAFQPTSYCIEYYKYWHEQNSWENVSSIECKNLVPVYHDASTAISANSVALLKLCK
tara:strand:- start:2852 stop:3640 length:789 start_codon:yes stop_codon:yes gene_type:complete